MIFASKRHSLFILFAGFFITNAIAAELIGGKLIDIGRWYEKDIFIMSVGILPWPVVFILTDLINEYYGKSAVRKLSLITACLILYVFVILHLAIQIPAVNFSPVKDESFRNVFGQSMWIIIGSVTAFLIAQLIDVFVFWFIRSRTGKKMIWLRATGSTVVSQLFDTFIVGGIGLWLPARLFPEQFDFSTETYIKASLTGYSVKLLIAVLLTPLIYLAHNIADKYLGEEESKKIVKQTAKESLPKD